MHGRTYLSGGHARRDAKDHARERQARTDYQYRPVRADWNTSTIVHADGCRTAWFDPGTAYGLAHDRRDAAPMRTALA